MVKGKEGIEDTKASSKKIISQVIANLAPSFGLPLTERTRSMSVVRRALSVVRNKILRPETTFHHTHC
jgi:hypothetical protein